MLKYCVLYSYFETNESKKNLDFFLKNGISINNDIFYVFLINNHKYSVKFPNQNNIKIICRDNIGHDFGSWKHGLKSINEDTFDYFIFMNDSVCGPFLPRYIPNNLNWYAMFCKLLSEKVKLSGLTINYFPWHHHDLKNAIDLNICKMCIITSSNYIYKHVQSMMFCTDKIGLDILNKNIFNLPCIKYKDIYNKSRQNFIMKFEIGMSQQIIKNGYDIAALYICDIKKHKTGDVWYNNKYFNSTINPFETMFIKKNRVNSKIIDFYLKNL